MINYSRKETSASIAEARKSEEKGTFVDSGIKLTASRMLVQRTAQETSPEPVAIAYLGSNEKDGRRFLDAVKPLFQLWHKGHFVWPIDATDDELQEELYHLFTGNEIYRVLERLLPTSFHHENPCVPKRVEEEYEAIDEEGRVIIVGHTILVQPVGIDCPLELVYIQDTENKIPNKEFQGHYLKREFKGLHPIVVLLRLKKTAVAVK